MSYNAAFKVKVLKALCLFFGATILNFPVLAQQSGMINGRVTSSVDDAPLTGVTVKVKGTSHETITDAAGKFSIKASLGDSLILSYVGHAEKHVAVGSSQTIHVRMETSAKKLDDVVVIGYGSKVEGAVTGAISRVDHKTFETRPITNVQNALQGELPGVLVTRGSGRPGAESYNVQIRGASSINGNKPFILIDGVPGDLDFLNPDDIASLTVLKDAAAAIYGARAADGVILITTKKGKRGTPSIMYSGSYGIKTPVFLKDFANTLHLAEMYNEAMGNIGLPGASQEVIDKIKANAPPDPVGWLKFLENFPGFYGTHSWSDDVFGNGSLQNHNVTISGGGDNSSYFFSAGYERNKSAFKYGKNYSDRYNLRMNYDFKFFDRLNIETRTSFSNVNNIEPSNLDQILLSIHQTGPYVPIYNPGGQLYKYQGGFRNPIQYLLQSGERKSAYPTISTNIKGDLDIISGLKLVAQAGINLGVSNASVTNPTFNEYNWDGSLFGVVNNPNSATYWNSKTLYQIYTGYLDYNKTLFDRHQFNLMAGTSSEMNKTEGMNVTGKNFKSNEIFTLNLADNTNVAYFNSTGYASAWALHSYFGRFSYSYDKKYFLDFSARMDGSSKFAPSKRWSALFPSLALAWNLSKEGFIESLNLFDNLKLRGSWGQTGNQELNFGNYDYIPLIAVGGLYPMGNPVVGLPGATSNIASASRTWETIETSNIGVDFAFLRSRLTGSFDYYIKKNKDMLVYSELPAVLGGTAPTQNIGELKTKGWEFSVKWSDRIGNFKYSIAPMISDSKNKLVELKGNDTYTEGLVVARQGYPLNSYFGYESEGIIKTAEQLENYKKLGNLPAGLDLGDMMFRDLDGDGKITSFGDPSKGSKGDMKYLGNFVPRYLYSTNINLSYKNFGLGIFLQGVGQRKGLRTGITGYPFFRIYHPQLEYFYGKTWTPENPDARYPRIIPGGLGFDQLSLWNWRTSDMSLVNLAYLSVKVVTLNYNLPQSLCDKFKMQNARVYLSGADLFVFAKDTWNRSFSPEDTWERTDERTYPFNRTISLGLDIKF